ncbi:MAG: response regulator [Chloroflexi bacterium]|nr:MAG: response regulator [Chloroflexota bacterium]
MKTRVLVVDDELDTLNLLRTILDISGFAPITTLNSVDAVGLAEIEKPDVVLLDIMMPNLDGFMLCKMLRANDATKKLPIIFVTAYEALDLEDRRIEAGANKVINKPIDMDSLILAIDTLLKEPAVVSTPVPAVPTPPSSDAPSDRSPAITQEGTPAVNSAVRPRRFFGKRKDTN